MKKLALIVGALALPLVSFAQELGGVLDKANTWVASLQRIVDILIPVAFALGLLVFFWGLIKYIFGGMEDKGKAKDLMIWGIVALFVMASVWGLERFIGNTFGVATDEKAPSGSDLSPL
jgi:hypothetical protein